MPDWSDSVTERIEFRTDGIQALDGSEQTRRTRITPRRRFEFSIAEQHTHRQAAATLAWARGSKPVYLPIWTEGVRLESPTPAASDTVAAEIGGRDFPLGSLAVLRGHTPDQVELVQIAAVTPGAVQFTGSTASGFEAGAMLLPVRRARFDSAFTTSAFNRSLAYGRQRFLVDEPNPYQAEAPGLTYRGFPVLGTRPSYAKDPETSMDRMAYRVDDDVGLVADHDDVGAPLYRQVHDWNLAGRWQLESFRRLLYALSGKRNSLWVPTWLDDLTLAAPMAAGSTTLRAAWTGYAANIAQASNRRDLRIELASGAVLFRRIMASADNGDGTESMTIDAPLGTAVTPAQVSQVSFMGLCRSDSDQFELGWWRWDYADCSTAWRARKHDL